MHGIQGRLHIFIFCWFYLKACEQPAHFLLAMILQMK